MSPDLSDAIQNCIHHAIEGGDCELIDAVAVLARVAGLPYDAAECCECGGWANKAAAVCGQDGWICGSCY